MAAKYNWKDLAGTAKKWLDTKVTETTTADHRKRDNAAGNEHGTLLVLKEPVDGVQLQLDGYIDSLDLTCVIQRLRSDSPSPSR
jgi:hypothetical protein